MLQKLASSSEQPDPEYLNARLRLLARTILILWTVCSVALLFLSTEEDRFKAHHLAPGELQRHFAPLRLGQGIGEGWSFQGIRHYNNGIRLDFFRQDRAPHNCWLYVMPAAFERYVPVQHETLTGLRISAIHPAALRQDAHLRKLVGTVTKSLRYTPDSIFWETNKQRVYLRRGAATWFFVSLLGMLYLLFIVKASPLVNSGFGYSLSVCWQRFGELPVSEKSMLALPIILLTLGGPLISAEFPFSVVHSNHHGWEHLDDILCPVESPYPDYYGNVFPAFWDGVFRFLLPQVEASLIGVQVFLHFSAGLLAAYLIWMWSGALPTAFLAWTFLLFNPQLLRLMASESRFPLIIFLTLLGCVFMERSWRRVDYEQLFSWIIGVCAIGLAACLQASTMGLAILPGIAMILNWRRKKHLWEAFLVLIPLISMVALHFRWLSESAIQGNTHLLTNLEWLERLATRQNLLLWMPPFMPFVVAGALLALVWFIARKHWLVLGMVIIVATSLLPSFLVARCLTDMLRYQSLPVVFLSLLAAWGWGMVAQVRWLNARGWAKCRTLLPLCVGLGYIGYSLVLGSTQLYDREAQEHLVLQRHEEALPPRFMLLNAVDQPRKSPGNYFPEYLFLEQDKIFTLTSPTDLVKQLEGGMPLPAEPVYLFKGMSLAWQDEKGRSNATDQALSVLRRHTWSESVFSTEVARPQVNLGHGNVEFNPLREDSTVITLERMHPIR